MTYEEAVSLKSFAHYCNCGAAHDPSRTGPNQHAHWCPQAEEYAAWWTAIHARCQAQLDECNRRINEMMPRELTQTQVDGFMRDSPSINAAIRAAYAVGYDAGHDAGWNAGREWLEHEENDE